MEEASEEQREAVRRVVRNGQLEFVGGGWVQHDTTLTDIDMQTFNLAAGHRYLLEVFNISSVRVAWDIDSFGSSALTPGVLARFGYRYLVVNRVDGDMKMYLRHRSSTEFLWATGAVGGYEKVLTHVLNNHYEVPLFLNPNSQEFCFHNTTIDMCARRFVDMMQLYAQFTGSASVLLLYGGDFAFAPAYDRASLLFTALHTLVSYFDSSPLYERVKIKLSTPSDYFESIYNSDREFGVFAGELLPYMQSRESASPHYWTGLYTTRPNLKRTIKAAMSSVRTAKVMSAVVLGADYPDAGLAEGLHHDGITGTMREHVATRLQNTIEKVCATSRAQTAKAAFAMLKTDTQKREGRALVFVNSLNWLREAVLSVNSPHPFIEIRSPNDTAVPSQYVSNATDSSYTIYFLAVLPSLSATVYFAVEHSFECPNCAVSSQQTDSRTIANSEFTVSIAETGLLDYVERRGFGRFSFNRVEFRTYSSQQSGAYVFKPTSKSHPFEPFSLSATTHLTGPVLSLYTSVWLAPHNSTFAQSVLLPTTPLGYFSVSISTFALGNETMLELEPDIRTDIPWFHTFTGGDLRQHTFFDPVFSARTGKNFVPVTSAVYIGNITHGLSLFPDYPLGGGMVSKGAFALHLHRSTATDDGNGLESGALDDSQAEHNFRLTLGRACDSDLWRHSLEQSSEIELIDGGENWQGLTNAGVDYEDETVYVQSIDGYQGETLVRVLNLRSHPNKFSLEGLHRKTGLAGTPLTHEGFVPSTKQLCFETCANGATVAFYRHRGGRKGEDLLPYEFSAFVGRLPKNWVREGRWGQRQPVRYAEQGLESFYLEFQPVLIEPVRPKEDTAPVVLTGRPYDFMSRKPTRPSIQVVATPIPNRENSEYWVLWMLEGLSLGAVVVMVTLLCRRKGRREKKALSPV